MLPEPGIYAAWGINELGMKTNRGPFGRNYKRAESFGGDIAVEEPNRRQRAFVGPHAPFDPISIVTTLAAERVVGAAH